MTEGQAIAYQMGYDCGIDPDYYGNVPPDFGDQKSDWSKDPLKQAWINGNIQGRNKRPEKVIELPSTTLKEAIQIIYKKLVEEFQ